MLEPILLSFLFSLLVGLFLIRYLHLHQHFSGDSPQNQPQKFHLGFTPRIGGIPILAGCSIGMTLGYSKGLLDLGTAQAWLWAILPVFLAGTFEDLTKRVPPFWRLVASFASAVVGVWLLDAILPRLAIIGIDHVFHLFPLIALIITVVAVGGICHSLNIIDGYNGLAGGVACIILAALGYICLKVGDTELFFLCSVTTAATMGFLAWNYPRGLIFAGDGGAYLLGFIIAEVSVLLVVRHTQVSPWFPFTLVMYPVWETVFTMYRRKFIQGNATGLPDALHLHQIVFSRLVRWMVGKREVKHLARRNALTTPYLWGMGLLTVMPALLFWQHTGVLQGICLLFVVLYIWLYRRLVSFRAPKWLMLHRTNHVISYKKKIINKK